MLSFFKKFSLKFKLVSFIIAILIASIVAVVVISHTKSKQALGQLTENQLSSTGQSIYKSIDWFLGRTQNFTSILSRDRLVEGLLIAYESSFFGSNFDPGEDLKIDNNFYQKLDTIYGERKSKLLTEYELRDILLVSLDAQVIFTANNKQKDFYLGKNLENGVFKGSPLAKCYKNAVEAEKQTLFFSGFKYSDVTKQVNGYICSKKVAEFANQDEGIDKGDTIGVLITQIESKILNEILTARAGMGNTGQSYLVGDDKLLRSDFFINKENFNAINSMKNKILIENKAVESALSGETGLATNINPNGAEVMSYYQPLKFMNNNFAIVTEKTAEEIYESITSTLIFVIVLSCVLLLIVIIFTVLVTNSIVAPIVATRDFLQELSQSLREGAESLKDYSNKLRAGAEDTSSSIHETVSTMNELSQMVNQNLENIKQTSRGSTEMTDSANKGKKETTQMMVSMNDISNNNNDIVATINDINTRISEFKEVITNISDKTAIINDIVSQTKLLSFNASVEAARAGELGKGFAVVAEEVGNLASASGEASTEIGSLIEDSISQVENMIKDITGKVEDVKRTTKDKISTGKEKAEACENSLSLILNQINGVTNRISEINVASNEQASGIEEISSAMTVLSETSRQTSSVANDTLSSSEDILGQSEKLEEIYKNLDSLVTGQK